MRRGHLLFVLAGCYSPDPRDCTISCGSATQCLDGQVCGSDGLCAAPKVAGHCAMLDSGAMVTLAITIDGTGSVTVDTIGTCSDTAPHHACMFQVPARTTRSIAAVATSADHPFVSWMQACTGIATTCSLVPVMSPTQVGAKFQ